MIRQTDVSYSIHVGRGRLDRRHFTRFLTVAVVLITVLLMSACGAAVPTAENQLEVLSAAEQTNIVAEGAHVRPVDELSQSLSQDIEAVRQQNFLSFRALEDSVTDQPLSFDIEHLRQMYDANWGIEADAADVRRFVQPIKGNGASEPPTFDIQHLRRIYDGNWGIEADVVDLNPANLLSSIFLAANPELSVVSRYSAAAEMEVNRPATLDIEAVRQQNFMALQSFNAGSSVPGIVAGEPTIFAIEYLRQIYDANWGIEADAPDARRFVQPIKGNGASEPPIFDIEHLRQIYDANWSIEADSVDLNPADQSSIFLAANPELMVVHYYTGAIRNEILPALSHTGFPDKSTLDAFLEANPELRFARRRLAAAMETGDDSTYLATDPAVEPVVVPEQSLDFWIDILSRNYNQ